VVLGLQVVQEAQAALEVQMVILGELTGAVVELMAVAVVVELRTKVTLVVVVAQSVSFTPEQLVASHQRIQETCNA
jgi:hypothetical protein